MRGDRQKVRGKRRRNVSGMAAKRLREPQERIVFGITTVNLL